MPENQAVYSLIHHCHWCIVENGRFDLDSVSPSLKEFCFTEVVFKTKGLELMGYESCRHAKCNMPDQKSEFLNNQVLFFSWFDSATRYTFSNGIIGMQGGIYRFFALFSSQVVQSILTNHPPKCPFCVLAAAQ